MKKQWDSYVKNFNVDDVALVKSWKEMSDEFGTESKHIRGPVNVFAQGMKKHCNTIVVIKSIECDVYRIKKDRIHCYYDWMFKHPIIEKLKMLDKLEG